MDGSTSRQALTDGYAMAFRTSGFILLAGVVVLLVWMPRTQRTAARETA